MQVENQADQVEKLLQACKTFQSADERACETDADAKAEIEQHTQVD